MEGERERLARGPAQPGGDPLPQFARGLAAEREHEHPGGIGAAIDYPVRDRLDDRGGLPGAGTGEHQQRATAVADHPLLPLVQRRRLRRQAAGGRGGSRTRACPYAPACLMFGSYGIPADTADSTRTYPAGAGESPPGQAGVTGPAGAPHVHPDRRIGRTERGALLTVAGQRGSLMTWRRRAVGVDHPPPGDAAAPQRHDSPDLTGTALAQVFGDVAVGHHPARRYRVHHVEDPAREATELAGPPAVIGHWSPSCAHCHPTRSGYPVFPLSAAGPATESARPDEPGQPEAARASEPSASAMKPMSAPGPRLEAGGRVMRPGPRRSAPRPPVPGERPGVNCRALASAPAASRCRTRRLGRTRREARSSCGRERVATCGAGNLG